MYAGTVTATTKENLNSRGTIFISGLKLPYIFKLWMCYSKNLLGGTYLQYNSNKRYDLLPGGWGSHESFDLEKSIGIYGKLGQSKGKE